MSVSVRSTSLGAAFDLLAAYAPPDGFFFEKDGLGVSTDSLGDALQVGPVSDLPALSRAAEVALREIADGGDATPLAVGALPFATAPVSVWVPRRTVVRAEDGETWLLDLAGDGEAVPAFQPDRVVGELPHEAFRPVQLTEVPSAPVYAEGVRAAVNLIQAGEVEKVVLARTLCVDAGRELDARRLLHRLRAVEPHCYAFAAPTRHGPPSSVAGENTEVPAQSREPTRGGARIRPLVGASPELLVSRRGDRVRSMPLAGTAPRSGDPDADLANAEALAASGKDREEHAIVVAAVADVLGGFCDDLTFDAEPVLEPTANVWHLATRFEGTLRDRSVTALDLVAELHPTPAVCGTPEMAARSCITRSEGFDRGAYAGPVGWVDARGDGDWAIALRCAELDGTRATLYAGAGIVGGSDPASELDETDRKFRAFLDSLRWG